VRTMVIEHAVRRQVAMDHELGMSMVFTLVNVLGRSDRQQADGHAQYARDDSGHPHRGIVCEKGLPQQTPPALTCNGTTAGSRTCGASAEGFVAAGCAEFDWPVRRRASPWVRPRTSQRFTGLTSSLAPRALLFRQSLSRRRSLPHERRGHIR
jgi:hypothetical protein